MVEQTNTFGIDNSIKFGDEFNDKTVITAKPIRKLNPNHHFRYFNSAVDS